MSKRKDQEYGYDEQNSESEDDDRLLISHLSEFEQGFYKKQKICNDNSDTIQPNPDGEFGIDFGEPSNLILSQIELKTRTKLPISYSEPYFLNDIIKCKTIPRPCTQAELNTIVTSLSCASLKDSEELPLSSGLLRGVFTQKDLTSEVFD